MNPSSKKNDITASQPNVLTLLDFCKGLAIAWVFLVHYLPGWFGWQGVHIFIVLSGFGLTYSCLKKSDDISWKQWYLRRFERILPCYWLVSFSGLLILICLFIFKRQDIVTNIFKSAINIILGLLLLQNLSYETMFTPPTSDPLWYIPLICGFYLVFPLLYKLTLKYRTIKGYSLILLGFAAIEFIYRAISIYWLDGFPIGFESPLKMGHLSLLPLKPLNTLPNTFLFPFQQQAPFGLFPSRIAEFTLGMFGAILLVQSHPKFHKVFVNYWMGAIGIFLWLAGYSLVFAGLWGWVFADFLLSLGLILWVVNLAWICQQIFSFLFVKLSQLGYWSFYIFLTHHTFIYLSWEIEAVLGLHENLLLIIKTSLLLFIIFGTWVTSWLLIKFDKSRFPKVIMQTSVARLLKF